MDISSFNIPKYRNSLIILLKIRKDVSIQAPSIRSRLPFILIVRHSYRSPFPTIFVSPWGADVQSRLMLCTIVWCAKLWRSVPLLKKVLQLTNYREYPDICMQGVGFELSQITKVGVVQC